MAKSVDQALEERGSKANLLKGSDLKKNQSSIKIKILGVRDAPKSWGGPYVFDIKCDVEGAEAFAPNKTSVKNLNDKYPANDPNEDWTGKTIILNKILVTNPTTGKMTFGLFYGDFEQE